ncbi:hypothetical protein AcW1_001838 [Taiwanofungus camphoratus]|nr:hypothetical protein AcV5_000112 [Antrodia cinnamomea]KAI0945054.1 hypothetical protein AcV7_001691 [Antrodia cinnamomea]KAI0945672.1 hypothetical protein AcW1_001838 [Antrodia cinnamomea]
MMPKPTPGLSKNVTVIGAGVIGLTTALTIQERGGYNVIIIAESLPSDPKTSRYTSLWAGAHHVSHATDTAKERKIKQDTFKVMWDLSASGGDVEGCFLRATEDEFFYTDTDVSSNWMPDFRVLPEAELASNAKTGISFTTLTIDTYLYLNYLMSRFLAHGGIIVRGAVQHINQVIEGGAYVFTRGRASPALVDALIVCPGLGARSLGGVEDKDVYPSRGQVILIRAPWITSVRRASGLEEGLWTYIIPRRNGDVLLGGTKVDNDWYPIARPETTEDILQRCLQLCPELAPPEIRAERPPTTNDLRPLILEEGCGLRPVRKGGIRIGLEWIDDSKDSRKIPMVLNYGHGGGGYQTSWGTASIVLNLLEDAFASM